jgi:hypothetical protein
MTNENHLSPVRTLTRERRDRGEILNLFYDDKDHWIPACAGMTVGNALFAFDLSDLHRFSPRLIKFLVCAFNQKFTAFDLSDFIRLHQRPI